MFRWGLLIVFVVLLGVYNEFSYLRTSERNLAFERTVELNPMASSSNELDVPNETSTTSVALDPMPAKEEDEPKSPEPPVKEPFLLAPTTTEQSSIATDSPSKIKKDEILPVSVDVLNEKARSALVNILCEAGSPLRSTSGSGVIIDPRGIILTNAHVAQYFLLEGTRYGVSCTIRTGSPARAAWRAKLIFLPSQWVEKHTKDLLLSRATGTGEHDYALLAVTEAVTDSLPDTFPFIPLDTEEATVVPGDNVLVAGYPAEFVGGRAARDSLFASSVFSTIMKLLTFTERMVDAVSISGTALAQSGSSGGGFISLTGSLVGVVVTTSIADTTGARDLHAITPAHIDRSIKVHTGITISQLLSLPLSELVRRFSSEDYEAQSKKLIDAIEQSQQ